MHKNVSQIIDMKASLSSYHMFLGILQQKYLQELVKERSPLAGKQNTNWI